MSDTSESDTRCPYIEKCPMFPEFRSRAVLKIFQINFCEGSYTNCERYRSAKRGVMPESTLLPDGTQLKKRS